MKKIDFFAALTAMFHRSAVHCRDCLFRQQMNLVMPKRQCLEVSYSTKQIICTIGGSSAIPSEDNESLTNFGVKFLFNLPFSVHTHSPS